MSEIELKAREILDSKADHYLPEDEGRYVLVESAVEAIASALSPQWQQIESAPKDGTAVLVMRNKWPGCKNGVAQECNGYNTYVAAWWDGERGGAGAWICYMHAFREPQCPIEPTHWQPLPAPPEVEG